MLKTGDEYRASLRDGRVVLAAAQPDPDTPVVLAPCSPSVSGASTDR